MTYLSSGGLIHQKTTRRHNIALMLASAIGLDGSKHEHNMAHSVMHHTQAQRKTNIK